MITTLLARRTLTLAVALLIVLPRPSAAANKRHPRDTKPPTVSITTPAANATVTGTVSVSATASDNVGVVGVQFQLDGATLGSEVTTRPYTVNWNTTTASNGTHTLTAVARDAAGNSTTSAGVLVNVFNAVPLTANTGGPYSGTVGQPTQFGGSASGGSSPYTYAWSFGDGAFGSTATPTHAYVTQGTFTVTLTVTDSASHSASNSTTAMIGSASSDLVRPQPVALNTRSSQYVNLVAAWPLWITNPSDNAVDIVNGISGSPTKIAVQTDPTMGNVFFSNGLSHFKVPYDTRLDFAYPGDTARPFSVSVWVKITISSSTMSHADNPYNMYVYTFDANSLQAAWPGHSLGAAATLSNNGPITSEVDIDGHQAQETMFGNKIINDGKWHHIVFTYTPDPSSNHPSSTGRIYVDGVLDSTRTTIAQLESPLVVQHPDNPFAMYIGADDDGTSNPWFGMFCDLRFYNVTLTAAQVGAMFNPLTRWDLYR